MQVTSKQQYTLQMLFESNHGPNYAITGWVAESTVYPTVK